MKKFLVFAEHSADDFKRSTYELLTALRGQAEVTVLAMGPGADKLTEKISGWGVGRVLVCADGNLQNYNPEIYTDFVCKVVSEEKPQWILASSTMLARDLFPRIAARCDAAFASDCTEFSLNGDQVSVRRPFYAGKCSATVEFIGDGLKIVLMRPNQLPVGNAESGNPEVKTLTLAPADVKTKVKDVVKGSSEKADLTEANIIVSGGRGMQGPEHFKLLEELAATLGATVGASRAVVDAGWVPHSMQVGQTGKTVAPSLYIACGISGAIQHLAGMSGSKVIVAINKDAEAPIFQKANYGIVGDVFEVLPLLKKEFEAIRR